MATRRPLLVCAVLCATLGTAALAPHARADEPVPPAPDTNPAVYPPAAAQPNLILIGGVVAAVWYGAGVGVSYLWSDSPGARPLRIPVAGPYMALAKTGCGEAEPGCGTFTVVLRTVFTVLSAVGQTGGTLAMVEGLFLPTRSGGVAPPPPPRLERRDAGLAPGKVQITPFVSENDALGVGLFTNF